MLSMLYFAQGHRPKACGYERVELYMQLSSTTSGKAGSNPMGEGAPIVYVVDDDISVREALEALIRESGWRPRVFASAQECFCISFANCHAELLSARRFAPRSQRP